MNDTEKRGVLEANGCFIKSLLNIKFHRLDTDYDCYCGRPNEVIKLKLQCKARKRWRQNRGNL